MHPAGPLSCPTAGLLACLSACLLLATGCKGPDTAAPSAIIVATAYGDVLTAADLKADMPAGLSTRDSAGWADRIIADWHQRRAIVHLAQTELPEMERNFEREVAQYREALYLHAYEDRYLREHLDTTVTSAELQAFLDEQPDLFRTAEPLYRARWVVFPDEAPFPRDIRGLQKQLASNDPEELSALASRCEDAGMPHDLDAERWWTWGSWAPSSCSTQGIPPAVLPASPNRLVCRHGRPPRLDQRPLLVTERLASGAISPVERVADRITELLLHRRRNRTLSDMRQQAVQAAWAEAALSKQDHDAAPAASPDRNPQNDTP